MTNEEAKVFLDNLKICINEHPVVADWFVEIANRKTEPTISKMEQVEGESQTCDNCKLKGSTKWCNNQVVCRAYKPKDEPQTDYDKGLKLFADILFDNEKNEQFLKECKAMGIEIQTEGSE